MISWIRNKTDILDQETLEGIQSRFYNFCEINKIDKTEKSWDQFWFPVTYHDFLELSGANIVYEGEEVVFTKPSYFDYSNDNKKSGIFGPEECHINDDLRFGTDWSRGSDVKYPIDTDVRIRISFKEEKHMHQCVYASYNELRGYVNSGRNGHWSENFTFKSSAPCNKFFANVSMSNNWISDPLYRKTPNGQDTVEDLIKPGTIVKTNYGDTEYIVKSVTKYIYKPIERPDDHTFENYSLVLIDKKTNKGGSYLNELVAVDGKILKLFMANDDEVFILGNIDEMPIEIKDESDDEDYDECCGSSCSIDDDLDDGDIVMLDIPNQVKVVTQMTFEF